MPLVPSLRSALAALLLAGSAAPLAAQDAASLLATATARLGGAARLDSMYRVRLSYQTLWYRQTFLPSPSGLPVLGSIEDNIDVRDYRRRAWRSERRLNGPEGPPQIVNIVDDTIASTTFGTTTRPQNTAYVTERDELFLSTPQWLLRRLAAADVAPTLRRAADTVIAGRRHQVLTTRLDGRPLTLWIGLDGWLTGMRYVAAQPLDFGLAGFGEMPVTVWYEQWRMNGGIAVPGVVTTRREGEVYKQIVLRRVEWMPQLDAATFAIADSVRAAYLADRGRAMQDVPHDSLVTPTPGVVAFATPFAHPGAVRLQDGWMLLGAGAADLSAERAIARLEREGAPVRAALLFGTSPTSLGGVRALAARRLAVLLPADAAPATRVMLDGARGATLRTAAEGRWFQVAGDSVFIEPVRAPDSPGAVLVWIPRLRYAYLGAVGGVAVSAAFAQLDAHGFQPTHVGTAQSVARPISAVRPATPSAR